MHTTHRSALRHALRRASVVALASLGLTAATGSRVDLSPTAPPALVTDTLDDLRSAFVPGWALIDVSGDGVIDRVDARIIVADAPTTDEVVTAANVAGRLGYETSASALGYLTPVSSVSIGGDQGWIVLGSAVSALGLVPAGGATAPGEGALALTRGGSTPATGALLVTGYDATGLLAAGDYLSGRYPSIWDVEGDEWTDVAEAVGAFVASHGVDSAGVQIEAIVVKDGVAGVARASVEVTAEDDDTFQSVVEALRGEPEDDEEAEAEADAEEEEAAGDAAPTLDDLHFDGLHRLDVRVVGPDSEQVVAVRPEGDASTRPGSAPARGADASFTLSQLYSIEGLYRDTNRDLVPDETAAYLSVAGTNGARHLVDLATRIGLETAGARFPLAHVADQGDHPDEYGFPIIVGENHYQIGRLREDGSVPGWLDEGTVGSVRFVEGAFNDRNGLLVAGSDAAGTSGALEWMARRAPYLWEFGKGSYRLADAETQVRRFLQVREAPGQAALALHKLGTWMDRLGETGLMAGGDETSVAAPSRIEVEIAVEEAEDGLDELAESIVRTRFPRSSVSVSTHSTGFGVGDSVYDEAFDFPWEVDEARKVLREQVYPRVQTGAPASVELRVSEPPEIRDQLATEIREALTDAGAVDPDVTVLSAYKQGYSWLTDEVLPRLQAHDGAPIASIEIEYHTLEDADEVRWQTVAANTRWLQELYPVDAILARDLALDVDQVSFRPVRRPDAIYSVRVIGEDGSTILSDTFQPQYVVRPFFDLFPEYEQIRVTTGWLSASSGGTSLADERIVTDPEAFWDVLQTDVFGAIIDYVMDIQDGRPAPGNAPFFDEFTVNLRMSEPNHRIGLDEELISSLEALHEDIYFETLTLFDLIGDRYGVGGLDYPGRILPYIDPTGAGRPGRAEITITGKDRGVPELIARVERGNPSDVEYRRYALGTLPVPEPRLSGISLYSADEGDDTCGDSDEVGGCLFDTPVPVRRLLFEVEARDSVDRFDDFRERSSESAIDRTFLSAELISGLVTEMGRLHDAGLYTDAMSWDRVEETSILIRVEDAEDFHAFASVSQSEAPHSTRTRTLLAEGWEYDGAPMVQWETPIPPAENDSVMAKLNTFPGVDVYYVTDSFLGQPIWVADFLPPEAGLERGYVSQAKLNALKPTLFISGRQHANEVSSTSHMLRLAELLVTDPEYMEMLDEVNVVLHPIANPDGAELAVEMQEVNPDFMLHAGYLGSLGVDMTSGEQSDDPIYPESQVRKRIREAWLPDAYLNMHGYPSHEWVQYFAGYSAWVRSRRGGQRDWWSPRGWFIPGFGWTDDDENPEYTEAQFAMLDSVTASINAEADVAAMNDRMYARFRKYGSEDRSGFREYYHNGVLTYVSLRGGESIGNGPYSRRITYFSATTEAPDETARGEWLDLVATAGLAHSSALLRYLANGTFEVEREAEGFDGAVTRRVYRVRPVLPVREDGGD